MTERPIIFSAAMVLALLAGRKTMTRRLAWSEPFGLDVTHARAGALIRRGWKVSGEDDTGHRIGWRPSPWQKIAAGDRLWVRENLTRSGGYIQYAADAKTSHRIWPKTWRQDPRPSIHMPRSESRLTLDVLGNKIERLQEISEEDAIAEGVVANSFGVAGKVFGVQSPDGGWLGSSFATARDAYAALWMSLHGAGSWDANPEVVAPSFRVIMSNIDEVSPPAKTHTGRLAGPT